MNCDFAEEQILAAFDGPLAEPARRALEAHVASCESCAKFREIQVAADEVLASKFQEVVSDASLADRIRDRAVELAASRTPAWLPDVLNAAGVAVTVGVVGSLGLESAYSTVVLLGLLGLLGIVCYPLVLVRTE